MADNFF